MKRLACILLALLMAAAALTGCQSSGGGTPDGKERVVIACWGNQMLDSYTQ